MKVQVKRNRKCFYDTVVRSEGEKFQLKKIEDFSHESMEAIDFKPPKQGKKVSSLKEELEAAKQELKKIKSGEGVDKLKRDLALVNAELEKAKQELAAKGLPSAQ